MLNQSNARIKLPGPDDVTRHVLANGLSLLVRENWAGPAVVMRGLLRVGSADETLDQGGLAQFTTSLLTRGTKTRTFADIAESIESVGATLGIGSGLYLSSFGGKCLHDDFSMLLDILAEVLQHPSFPVEQVERVRGQMLNTIRQRDANTGAVAFGTFCRLVYPPKHPLAQPDGGTRETINTLQRSDLVQFYQSHFTPMAGLLAIVGAVHTNEVIELVERVLGGWQGAIANGAGSAPGTHPIDALTAARRETVALAGKTQSDLFLGSHGLARHDPDYLPLLMMNGVLGQIGIGGRLGAAVRERAGLAYYVSSSFQAGLTAGPWYTSAGVNPRHIDRAVDLILNELRRIRETPVEDAELADVKALWTGSLPLDVETNEGVASELLSMELYGLGLDYLHRLPGLIDTVTLGDVQAVAQRYLNPDAYALAVAGP